MKWFLAANSKLNESVLTPLVVVLKSGANQLNVLRRSVNLVQKGQLVMLAVLVKSKSSDTTLTMKINVAQSGLANVLSNLAHFTTKTQFAINTKLFTNLETLVVAARLVCVTLLPALKPEKLLKKLTVWLVKKSLLSFQALVDTERRAPLKQTAAHNSNVSATQNIAELQLSKIALLTSVALLKNYQSLLTLTETITLAAASTTKFALTNRNFAHQLQFVMEFALF